jgi:hypothetical protein
VLILPPGHYRQVREPRTRTGREKVLLSVGALVVAGLVAAFLFSLTAQGHKSGHGCIDFTYLTIIGGGETYECGQLARTLCIARIAKNAGDHAYYISLHEACRKAGLPTAPNPVSTGN